jgi:hypothetical protein
MPLPHRRSPVSTAAVAPGEGEGRRIVPLLVAALLIAFFLLGLHAALRNSAVSDEIGGHTTAGYLYLRTGEYSGGIGNFPLAQALMALPVVLLGLEYEPFTEQHLALFRLPSLLLGVGLGLLLYRFAAGVSGRLAALFAIILFALSPNMLAHGALATIDFPLAFFTLATWVALRAAVRRPSWIRMSVLGLALGAAMATKVQGFLLVPLVALGLILGPSLEAGRWTRPRPQWSWAAVVVIPWIVLHVVFWHSPLSGGGEIVPPLFLRALRMKLRHATGELPTGQIAYLNGEYSAKGWWYYFPVAVFVKTPIPTLLLLAAGLFATRSRRILAYGLVPAAAFLGAAMISRLNIGLRHVLMIYPFLFLIAGHGAAVLARWRAGRAVLGLLAVWMAASIAIHAPHHLSHFNELAGGPTNGHRVLIGSNFDLGQNDRYLEEYLAGSEDEVRINPDPFRPATGRILVKASALYGSYGLGGPQAFLWLKRFEPVRQIAYTWFEYDVPRDAFADESSPRIRPPRGPYRPWKRTVDPGELDRILPRLESHLRATGRSYADVMEDEYRLRLGRAYLATASYGCLLEEMRTILRNNPTSEAAIGFGGEIMVRWKVGGLRFRGRQYLNGPRCLDPDALAPPPSLDDVVNLAREAGVSRPISDAHFGLGLALEGLGRTPEAVEQFRTALRIAPAHAQAAARLIALGAAPETSGG